ncbi:MAG TPA: hypothetical protein VF463_05930 [Sphingobium sp.]
MSPLARRLLLWASPDKRGGRRSLLTPSRSAATPVAGALGGAPLRFARSGAVARYAGAFWSPFAAHPRFPGGLCWGGMKEEAMRQTTSRSARRKGAPDKGQTDAPRANLYDEVKVIVSAMSPSSGSSICPRAGM